MTIDQWMRSDNFKDLISDTHLLSRYWGDEKHKKAYNELVDIGAGIVSGNREGVHEISRAIKNYSNVVANYGFNRSEVIDLGNGAYDIVFHRGNIPAEECPHLMVGVTDDGGITIQNGLPSVNALTFVRNSQGEVGIASALAVGIDQATQEITKAYKSLELLSGKDLAAKIKFLTNRGVTALTQTNSAVYSHNQAKAIRSFWTP